ncbi:MAG: methyltransferase domain-containing protein [Tepidisphaeraceae bacterium]
MDDLDCHGEVVNQTLRELEFINKWLGGNTVTVDAFRKLVKGHEKETITVVDLGCGSGDMLRLLSDWGSKNKIKLKLIGIDANPHIIAFARERCADHPEIEFEAVDIFSEDFKRKKFDVAVGTLFYHHFDSAQLTSFFSELREQVGLGIIVNDIHRHRLAYYSIKWLTQLFSRSAMVKFDAPLSVLRAFTKQELKRILNDAGLTRYEIKWKWAFRWQVIWRQSLA